MESRRGFYHEGEIGKNLKKLIINYAILSIIIIVLTPFIWDFVAFLVPGYPFAIDPSTGIEIYQPVVGKADPLYVLVSPFLSALVAPMEPLFPYLAVSYIGSIIGIIISQPRDQIRTDYIKKMRFVGLIMFVTGSIGIILVIFGVMGGQGFDAAVDLYLYLSYHRHWSPDMPYVIVPPVAWLWQFLSLNGFAILAIMIIIRLVEFRGKGKQFAEKTTFIRRFGYIAFTNYTIQWIIYLTGYIMTILFVGTAISAYHQLNWGGTFLGIGFSLLVYHLIMIGWEKKRYIGSIEWCIRTVAFNIVPARRESIETKKKWWERGELNVDDAFYNAEWLNVIEENELKHEELQESKFAFKLSLVSLCSLVFMPASFISFAIARNSQKMEQKNKYNKKALVVSIIGMCIVVVFFLLCSILTLSDLGIYL